MAVEDIEEVSETTESTKTTGNIPNSVSGNIPNSVSGNIPNSVSGNIPNSVSVGNEAKSSDMIGTNLIVPDNDVINGHSAPGNSSTGVVIPNGEPEKATKADLVSIGSGGILESKDSKVESEVQELIKSQKNNSDDQAANLNERAAAESEEKATESEEKTAESEEKAAESEEKAAESEEKAAESEEKATESEEKAAESEEKTAESEEKAAESEEKATESEEKAAEPEEKTAEYEEKTAESEEKASESEEKAAEPEEKAAESEEKTAESEEKTVEYEEKAAESEEKAAEYEEKAKESEEKAAESEEKTAESEEKAADFQGQAAEVKISESQDEVTTEFSSAVTDLAETGVEISNDISDKQQKQEEDACLTTKIISDSPREKISLDSSNLNLHTDHLPVPETCTETSPLSKSSEYGSSADLESSESESEMGGEVKRCPHAHQFVNDLSSNESSSDEDTVDISALRKERRQKRRRKRQQRLKKCCSGCDNQGTVEPLLPDLPDPIAMSTGMMQCNVIKSFEEVVTTRYNSEEEIDAAISSYTAVGGRLANQNEQTFSDVDIAGYKSRSECGSPTSDPDLLVCDYSNSVGRKLANRNLNNQNDNLDECIGGFLLDSLNQNLDPTSRLFAMGVEELKKMSEGLRMKLQKVNEDLVNVVRENDDLKAEKSVITKHVTQLSRLVQGIRANDNSAFRKILVTRETDI